MILKVAGQKVDFFNNVGVQLRHDAVASGFAFSFAFNPDNPVHRKICKPCAYYPVSIEQDGETLLTGTLLNADFIDGAVPGMVELKGYSKTGVLEDSNIPDSVYPLQSDNINLKNITEKILKPFGIKLVVDAAVAADAAKVYKNSTGGDTQSIKSYLSELAAQRNILITHNELGDLVFTRSKAAAQSIFDFKQDTKGVGFRLSVDGRGMHSAITVQRQANKSKLELAVEEKATNPYAAASFRPRVERQSSGDDLNTKQAAQNLVCSELQNIKLSIEVEGWTLGGKIVRPNNVVTVLNPRVYCYRRTDWFVEAVEFMGNEIEQRCVLTCVLPEVYNGRVPKNIFE